MMQYHAVLKKRKGLATVLAGVLCAAAISLGGFAQTVPVPEADLLTPQGTLESAMKALKDVDMETFNQLSTNDRRNIPLQSGNDYLLFSGVMSARSSRAKGERAFALGITEKLSWTVGETVEKNGEATVALSITNRDLSDVTGLYSVAVTNATMNEGATTPSLEDYIRAADTMRTIELDVPIKKAKGGWQIQLDETFANAVYGNLMDGAEHYSAEIQEQIDLAEEELQKRAKKWSEEWLKEWRASWPQE